MKNLFKQNVLIFICLLVITFVASIILINVQEDENTDLIPAIGIEGTTGYILRSDLDGAGHLDKPHNPDEAIEYMEQLESLVKDAETRGDDYIYYIPLYASDGITVIGKFGISNPSLNNNPRS